MSELCNVRACVASASNGELPCGTHCVNQRSLYVVWIQKHVSPDPEAVFNACEIETLGMAEAFPELIRTRGHVLLSTGYERPHWWLVNPETQEVVDPTAHQFHGRYYGETTTIVEYRPWDEGSAEPLGKCMECGSLCYRQETMPFCSSDCETSYTNELMRECRA